MLGDRRRQKGCRFPASENREGEGVGHRGRAERGMRVFEIFVLIVDFSKVMSVGFFLKKNHYVITVFTHMVVLLLLTFFKLVII